MPEKSAKPRGGAVKKAPPGFYTAQEARNKLGLNASTFSYYVRQGKIKKYVPPLKTEGFYEKKEIDTMAEEIALFLALHLDPRTAIETRPAQPADAEGIVAVIEGLGWRCATPEQYRSWWKVNPLIHYVVLKDGVVVGNLACVPYRSDVLAERMAGRTRIWDVRPQDILPYREGIAHDVYVGIEVRQGTSESKIYASRLLGGFLHFLLHLAKSGIVIRHMYGVSAEPPGQRLAHNLGFAELPPEEGDFPNWRRYCLDLETSDSRFARLYREALGQIQEEVERS